MSQRSARVTAIVVNWNGAAMLPVCLESLRSQGPRPLRVILVDNGSQDGSAELVRRAYPEVELIALDENRGFSAANNLALRRVKSEFAALLNNDAQAHPQWLERLVAALESYPAAGMAASRMLYRDRPEVVDRAGDGYSRAGVGVLRGRGEPAGRWDRPQWVFGACAGAALYRTSMLKALGGFDERLFLLYEDVDLSYRAQLRGFRCRYVPDAIVYHAASASIGYDSPQAIYFGHRNLEWVYLKNTPGPLLLRSLVPHLLYDLAAGLFFTLKGGGTAFWRAKRDALCGLQPVLRQRRQIMAERCATHRYLWQTMQPERIWRRLTRRQRRRAAGKS